MSRNRRIFSYNYLQSQSCLRVSFKRMPTCAKLIYETSHSPNISFLIIRFFFTHFRRQIVRSSHNSVGEISSECSGDTKITDSYFFILSDENVHGLDISMQNFLFVELSKSKHDLKGKFPNSVLSKRFSHLSFHELSQISSATVFHAYIKFFLFDKRVKILDDILAVDSFHYFDLVHGLCLYNCTHYFILRSIAFKATYFITHIYPLSLRFALNTIPKDPAPNLLRI